MFMVISYDISDDKVRNRVLNILKDYGTHVQYSVFECNLTAGQFYQLKQRLLSLIKSDTDSIRIYILCDSCKRKMIIAGQGEFADDELVYVV